MAAVEKLFTKVSTKGQVILPKAVRDHRHWKPGTNLVVEETEDGVLLRRAPLFASSTIDQAFGMLAYEGEAKSIDEMTASVQAEARCRARD